ncbi:MAG: glutathione S-transferase family protein [Caulobacteraceae bacterium]|nr:MAG: glutathione S-transferase family protein [Caulobacteraceae bacterium]
MELVIGTKRWSTWSLRPWLALKHTGAPFTETLIALREVETSTAEIRKHSPSGLVPALKDAGVVIVDSLAICEYLAERFPGLWPADPVDRALARAAASEMHSGYGALRRECPMELGLRTVQPMSPEVEKDVRRIVALWLGLLDRSGGPFLLGGWSIADAFFTPVASRFESYGLDLKICGDDGRAQAYSEALLQTPEYLAWLADA